jgi:NAD(P)H-flavin reductase
MAMLGVHLEQCQETLVNNWHTNIHVLYSSLNWFTGRLRKQCLNYSKSVPLRLLFEGPYGHNFSSCTYDILVLVAVGRGIAGVLPYIRIYRKGPRTSRIKLSWTTKQAAMITEITKRSSYRASRLLILKEASTSPAK